MSIPVKVMQRFNRNNKCYGVVLFTVSLPFPPRVGDIVRLHARPPYEVVQVIIRSKDVVLEVKEYDPNKGQLITDITAV